MTTTIISTANKQNLFYPQCNFDRQAYSVNKI